MEKRTLCARALAVRLLSATLATSLVVAQTSPVWAQSEMERAGAREAAKEGAAAFGEKRWSDAIDLFTRAESLVHAPPHLLYIARASANMGQLVKARENYLKISREKIAAGAPAAFIDAQASANKELAALEPRMPSIKTTIAGGEGKAVKLTMDGKEVPSALVGLTMPVDPGDHVFKATAEGMASDDVKVNVREGAKATAALTLKPVAGGAVAAAPLPVAPPNGAAPPPPPPPGAPPAPPPPGAPPPAAPAAEHGSGSGMKIAGYTMGGVGILGLGLGGLMLSKSSSKKSDADALYTTYGCPPVNGSCTAANQADISKLDDDSKSAKTLAVVSFIGGGALLATGLVLVIASGGKEKPAEAAKSASVTPVFGPGSIGLVGQF